MAENLTPADVEQYTKGQLGAWDPETQRMLDEALGRARSFCGWHVSPVQSSTIKVRGSGYGYMILRTQKITSITSVTEIDQDGVSTVLDVNDFEVFTDESWAVYRRRCRPFDCRKTYQIVFSHGYSAAEAADFRGAVLQLIDAMAQSLGTGGGGPLSEFQVDDVKLAWANSRLPGSVVSNPMNDSPMYQYKIMAVA